jgi:hypothetical protein
MRAGTTVSNEGGKMNGQAADAVKGPAIGLMVTAGLGGLGQLIGLVLNIAGTGFGAMAGGNEGMVNMFSGGIGIVGSLIGLAMAGFIFYGASLMQKLQKYNMAMAASVIAMIPCISPCCIIGLPIGIWAIVVLVKPEVKAAFVG